MWNEVEALSWDTRAVIVNIIGRTGCFQLVRKVRRPAKIYIALSIRQKPTI